MDDAANFRDNLMSMEKRRKMSVEEYIREHGLKCPYCTDPRTEALERKNNTWVRKTCQACGMCWDEIYALVGILPVGL